MLTCQAERSLSQTRIQELEKEVQQLRTNLKNSAVLAEELTSLQNSKAELVLRFSQLEKEHSSLLSQIETIAPFLETVEKELNLRIHEITSLRETVNHNQTLIAKISVCLIFCQ